MPAKRQAERARSVERFLLHARGEDDCIFLLDASKDITRRKERTIASSPLLDASEDITRGKETSGRSVAELEALLLGWTPCVAGR